MLFVIILSCFSCSCISKSVLEQACSSSCNMPPFPPPFFLIYFVVHLSSHPFFISTVICTCMQRDELEEPTEVLSREVSRNWMVVSGDLQPVCTFTMGMHLLFIACVIKNKYLQRLRGSGIGEDFQGSLLTMAASSDHALMLWDATGEHISRVAASCLWSMAVPRVPLSANLTASDSASWQLCLSHYPLALPPHLPRTVGRNFHGWV